MINIIAELIVCLIFGIGVLSSLGVMFAIFFAIFHGNKRFYSFIDWVANNKWCFILYYPVVIGILILIGTLGYEEVS